MASEPTFSHWKVVFWPSVVRKKVIFLEGPSVKPKFWTNVTIVGYFVANLRTFWCIFTNQNNAVVYQN